VRAHGGVDHAGVGAGAQTQAVDRGREWQATPWSGGPGAC